MRLRDGWKDLADAARAAGWEITRTRGGHFRWQPPEGPPIFVASTPSDWRAISNTRAMLKRAGVVL